MEDPTQRNASEDNDDKLTPPEQPPKPGASESEFTQFSSRPDEPKRYEYAMPEEDNTVPTPFTPRSDIGGTLSVTRAADKRESRSQSVPTANTPYSTPPVPGIPSVIVSTPRPRKPRQNWTWVAFAVILFSTTVAVSSGLFIVLHVITSQRVELQTTATAVAVPSVTPPTLDPTTTPDLSIVA